MKWQWSQKRGSLLKIVLIGIIGLAGLFLYQPQTVSAHPLGNFSVNRYSRLEPGPETLFLLFVVDMAEVPAFQEQSLIDSDLNGRISDAERQAYISGQLTTLKSNLTLLVNGKTADLQPLSQSLTFPPGQGGLDTLRLELTFSADFPARSDQLNITYRDTNYLDRAGWQEIVVQPDTAVTLLQSSVPADSLSQELRQYPDDFLDQPVKVQEATFQFLPFVGAGTAESGSQAGSSVFSAVDGQEGGLFAQEQLSNLINIPAGPGPLLLAVGLAFILGALHALSPGHGKTIVGAYLVGSRGTARHALFLGLTTTITHTAGVFAFGLLVLFASQFILPERLYPWLGVLSGLLVVGIGFSLFRGRLAGFRHAYAHLRGHDHPHDHSHDHHGPHDHDHDHGPDGHSHLPEPDENGRITWRSLLALGISGGLLPCPSALVLLLSAIALQRVGLGLFLIVIFSLGLAAVLTAIGMTFVYAGRMLEKAPKAQRFGRLAPLLPVFSALFVTLAGAAITAQALIQTGILS